MNEPGKTTAEQLIGKQVIISITRLDYSQKLVRHEQFHGQVTAIDESIHIRLSTGQNYTLPPDPSAFFPADPGEYRLRSTGEVVVNPDFTTSWTITEPPPDGGPKK